MNSSGEIHGLGTSAPPFVHLLDLEFLAHRRGGFASEDPRRWFESKQAGSPDLLVDLAREATLAIAGRRRAEKRALPFPQRHVPLQRAAVRAAVLD